MDKKELLELAKYWDVKHEVLTVREGWKWESDGEPRSRIVYIFNPNEWASRIDVGILNKGGKKRALKAIKILQEGI